MLFKYYLLVFNHLESECETCCVTTAVLGHKRDLIYLWFYLTAFHRGCSPGGGRLALQICGAVVQRQQHLDGGELGGRRRGGTAVIIERDSGHGAAPLTLG